MQRRLFAILSLAALSGIPGCAICCTPFDHAYSAYGGKWQRPDMYRGRVGSVLAPAEMMAPAETVGPPASFPILHPAN